MRSALLLAFFALVALSFAETSDTVTAIVARDGFYRQLTVEANPSLVALQEGTATGVSVAAVGAQLDSSNGGQSGSASVDIAGFKFKNPADTASGKGLVFYFGYLGVSGNWDRTTQTAALNGALAEIASSWETIFIYYNNDNVPGFQWKTTSDLVDCGKGSTEKFDCVDSNGTIDIATQLTWGGITVSNTSCPAAYNNPNCTVWSFSTSSTDGVLTFTLRLASEPVLVNGVRIEPNYGKIDVTINYPFASRTLRDAANARVGIVAYTAGRAGTAGASYSNVDGNKAVEFKVNDKSAYFSWDSTATLAGVSSTVYADYHSGASIRAIDCSGLKCGFSTLFVIALQTRVAIFESLGWKTEALIFSWDALKPASVMWDPAIGLTPEQQASASAAVTSFAVVIFAIFARLF